MLFFIQILHLLLCVYPLHVKKPHLGIRIYKYKDYKSFLATKLRENFFGQYLEKILKVSHTLQQQQQTNKKEHKFNYKINFPNKFCLEN